MLVANARRLIKAKGVLAFLQILASGTRNEAVLTDVMQLLSTLAQSSAVAATVRCRVDHDNTVCTAHLQ